MSEILANTLEKIFGQNGCMEVVFKNLFRIALIVGIGYLGIKILSKSINNSSGLESSIITTPTPVLVSKMPQELTILPEPTEKPTGENCVYISPEIPNAFRAWLALGRPDELTFYNTNGPDGGPNNQQEITDQEGDGIINNLPHIVHSGDRFCTQ